MKIALVGYGKMNQAIEAAAVARGHEVVATITDTAQINDTVLEDIDLAFEFSTRESAPENMRLLIQADIPTIAGSTGCEDGVEAARRFADEKGVGFLWSANFSIGVNLFWEVVGEATKKFDRFAEYDVFGHESHHRHKQDSPSGTALQTVNAILENSSRKDTLVTDKLDRKPAENELHFSSVRGGSVPGHHVVTFDSPFNTVEIAQTARGSAEFATGAVLVAEWLEGKTGNYTMADFLHDSSSSS